MPMDPSDHALTLRRMADELAVGIGRGSPALTKLRNTLRVIADDLDPPNQGQVAAPTDGAAPAALPHLTPAVRTLVERARELALEAERYEESAGQERRRAEWSEGRAGVLHAQRIDLERALASLGPEGADGLVALATGRTDA